MGRELIGWDEHWEQSWTDDAKAGLVWVKTQIKADSEDIIATPRAEEEEAVSPTLTPTFLQSLFVAGGGCSHFALGGRSLHEEFMLI